MLMKVSTSQKGDTIIEVLIAMAILSIVVTTCYSIMNRTYAYALVSFERTTTQAMLSGQAAMLRDAQTRFIDAKGASPASDDWNDIVGTDGFVKAVGSPASAATDTGCVPPESGVDAFYFDPSADTTEPKDYTDMMYVRQATSPTYGDGMWIEGYKVTSGSGSYYEFYIKSCWDSPYGEVQQAMRTTVRLYEKN